MKSRFAVLAGLFFTVFVAGLTFAAPSHADVLYCVSDESTGFDPAENYKRKSYQNKRFQVMVDFAGERMISEKIWLKEKVTCITDNISNTLYCTSIYGTTLAVNRNTLKFHYTTIFLDPTPTDDIALSHGTCEKF